jgi:GrpB-like predicted nucleotidyltransferase (UPF0157 family)
LPNGPRAGLRNALGPLALGIEHYGSTSVPGLAAKPILDILVGGPQVTHAAPYVARLEPLGYDYAPQAGVPEHLIFGRGAARTHLVHVVLHGGPAWRRALSFRDALRGNPHLAADYQRLKRELATRHARERSEYSAAKTAFIEYVLQAVRR